MAMVMVKAQTKSEARSAHTCSDALKASLSLSHSLSLSRID
jgi:hypothetical protein